MVKTVRDMTASVRTFVDDVTAETKKATWPTRDELVESTILVVVTVVLLSVVVGVSDKILGTILKYLVFRS